MKYFEWDDLHQNCDLNKVRDKLWVFSRFFARRFENIINMIENDFYYEALFNLIALFENILKARAKDLDIEIKFQKLIDQQIVEPKRSLAHKIRKLRNSMAHDYPFQYYVKIANDEYPLDEECNYSVLLQKLIIPIIGCWDDDYNILIEFDLGKYSIQELAHQYGISELLNDILCEGVESGMPETEIRKIRKKNEMTFMRKLNNTSPVSYKTAILAQIFDLKNNKV